MKLKTKRVKGSKYKFSEGTVQLPAHDTDINVKLPSGKLIQLQFRVESPSIDVCLPYECGVTNWIGEDMTPAPPAGVGKKQAHMRLCNQLVIDLNPKDLEKR